MGASIAVVGRNVERLDAVAAELTQRWGVDACAVVADVIDPQSCERMVERVQGRLGGLDVLVHNAGGAMIDGKNRAGPFADAQWDDLDLTVDLNLFGAFNVVRPTLRSMLAGAGGRIVMVASEGAKMGGPNFAVYASSKAAVVGFVRSVAREVTDPRVSIVAVCPGTMLGDALIEKLRTFPADTEEVAHVKAMARITLGRCARPDEVASVVAFAATDVAAAFHGSVISAGGGMSD
jgi:3-oxoacyl-[acyl-carrier protein] reductase